MMNPLPLAISELRRQRAGAIAIVLLIAAAVAFGVAQVALERAVRQSSARAADRFDLVVGAAGDPMQLVLGTVYLRPAELTLVPPQMLEEIRADRGVDYAAPIAFGDSIGGHPVVGTTAEFLARRASILAEGRPFASLHDAVLGARVPFALGARLQPTHGAGHDGEGARHAFTYTAVGRMPPTGTPWDNAVLVPIEAMWDVHHHDHAGASAIVVKPRTVGDAYRLRQSLRAKGLAAVFPAEVLVELYDLLGGARDFGLVVARASQALVATAVLLALLAVVASRRRSTAVLRALGASSGYVFAVAWLQCFALFAAGAIAGLAAGGLGAHAAGYALGLATGIDIAVTLHASEWKEAGAQLAALALAATLPAATSLGGEVAEGLRA